LDGGPLENPPPQVGRVKFRRPGILDEAEAFGSGVVDDGGQGAGAEQAEAVHIGRDD
jgi:hypothetical protein